MVTESPNTPIVLLNYYAWKSRLGPLFDADVCATTAGKPHRVELETALAECRRLEVLRFSLLVPAKLQFDHDLIRLVLLEDMGCFRQRRLAGSLLAAVSDREGLGLLSSLAYQAGLADDCWRLAIRQADSAAVAMRHLEAVHGLGLALTVTDQNVAATIFDVQKGRYRPYFDEAIAVAEPCTRPAVDRRTRERETADLLLRYIEHLVAVGSGGSPSVEKALSEEAMLAERLGDRVLRATVTMYHGRQEFNRDRVLEAIELHQRAEAMFADLAPTEDVRSRRASNLLRLAVGYHQTHEFDRSRRTLVQSLKVRRDQDRHLSAQIRSNLGATFLYEDWSMTRHHWERALRIAKRWGLVDRYVHSLVDLGYLDLLEDMVDSAAQKLEEALAVCRDYGLENSELRCLLNLGSVALMRGEPNQALDLLRDADALGFRHRVGRRLWRVRANLATTYFILGDMDRSALTDRMTVRSVLPDDVDTSAVAWRFSCRTTVLLAFANLLLRARDSEAHRQLFLNIPNVAQEPARELVDHLLRDQADQIGGLRGRRCKTLSGHRFFLLTE